MASYPSFGKEMRKEFHLDPDVALLNHGSWGAIPKTIFNARMKRLQEIETNPDAYFRQNHKKLWKENIAPIAEFLGAKEENLVFVENTTTGINDIMKSLPLSAGDGIMVYDWQYNAIRMTVEDAASRTGAQVVCMKMQIPIQSQQEFIDNFTTLLKDNPKIKVAVLEYICSPTAVLFPIPALIKVCRDHNVISLVDGAHTPGQIPLHLETLGCDFFVGNLHKWMYVPRGCAVLWADPKHHAYTRPTVTSHAYKSEIMSERFVSRGTRDFTPYDVVKESLQFYKDIGGMEAINKYIGDLLDQAVELLVKTWGTDTFPIPKDMEAPHMRMVRLPDLKAYPITKPEAVFMDTLALTTDLRDKGILTATFGVHGKPWVRISAQIYNSIDEYEKLAKAVLDIKNDEGSNS